MTKWDVLILTLDRKGKTTHRAELAVSASNQQSAIAYVGAGGAAITAKPDDTVMVSATPAPKHENEIEIIIDVPRPDWTPELNRLYDAREDNVEAEQHFLARLADHNAKRAQRAK